MRGSIPSLSGSVSAFLWVLCVVLFRPVRESMDLIVFVGAIYVIGKWLTRRSAESRAQTRHNAHFAGASTNYDQVSDPENIDCMIGESWAGLQCHCQLLDSIPPKHDTDLLVDEYTVAHHIFPKYG